MLEKFRAASQDPAIEEQRAKRAAIHQARLVRAAEREAAKKAREAELAAQAAREADWPHRRHAKPKKPRRAPRLRKPTVWRSWRLSRKRLGMRDTRPARLTKGSSPGLLSNPGVIAPVVYSTLIFAARTISPNRCTSGLMTSANAPGALATISKPTSASGLATASLCSAATSSRLSLSMIG